MYLWRDCVRIVHKNAIISPSTLVHLPVRVSSSSDQRRQTGARRSCQSSWPGSSSPWPGPRWKSTGLTCRRSHILDHTFEPAPCPARSGWSVWGVFLLLCQGGIFVGWWSEYIFFRLLTWWRFHGPLPKRRVGGITAGTPHFSTWMLGWILF